MSIVGEVIENLMGDSYHSLYLRDYRYFSSSSDVPGKHRKISQPVALGKFKTEDTKSILLFDIVKFLG